MKRLCFGTVFTILHQCRNNPKVTIPLMCQSIAFAYGTDISNYYDTETAYNKIKGGTQNPPDPLIEAARGKDIDNLIKGISGNVLPLLKKNSNKSIVLALRDVIKDDDHILNETVIGYDGFTKETICSNEYIYFAALLAAVLQYTILEIDNTSYATVVKEIPKKYVSSFDNSSEKIYIDPAPIPIEDPLNKTIDDTDFDNTFFPVDSVDVMGIDHKSSAHIYCVNMANRKFQFRNMKSYLIDNIGNYVLSRSEMNRLKSDKNPGRVGARALLEFQNTYKDKTENVLGEMLLYVFMEQVLKAPKIMSRIELDKTTGVISKSDGIHLYSGNFADRNFYQVVFGASDLEGDLITAADRAFTKIINIEKDHDNEFTMVDNTIYQGYFDDKQSEFIRNAIFPKRGSMRSTDTGFGMFLGYTIDLSSFGAEHADNAEKKMKEDIATLKEYIKGKIIRDKLDGYDFYIYVIPFNDADNEKISLVNEIIPRGGGE